MKLSVTQDHIDKGERKNPRNCPIALAAKDAGLVKPHVTPFYICHGETSIRKRSQLLPQVATNFVLEFDKGNGPLLQPFEFEFDP